MEDSAKGGHTCDRPPHDHTITLERWDAWYQQGRVDAAWDHKYQSRLIIPEGDPVTLFGPVLAGKVVRYLNGYVDYFAKKAT